MTPGSLDGAAGGRPLGGGTRTAVWRVGDVVMRDAGPQSPAVVALLAHLRDVGFDAAPRPVEDGFTSDGREALTFLPGETPHPSAWTEEAAFRVGVMLRELHDATSGFVEPADALWRPWFARSLRGDRPVIGHGDLGPWNVLAIDGVPVAFIDWENAGPVDAVWELAQVAWLNAHLHDDDVAERVGLPDAAARMQHCAAVLDGYGLRPADRVGFTDRMIEFAVRSARDEAVQYGIDPDTPSPAHDGFPVLWAVTWRTRSAAWMLDHRDDIERAIAGR